MVAFFALPLGAMLRKLAIFKEGQYVHIVPFFVLPPMKISIAKANVLVWKHSKRLHLNENDNFKTGKQSCMVTELHMGAILTKMTMLQVWKLIIHGYNKLYGAILMRIKTIKYINGDII